MIVKLTDLTGTTTYDSLRVIVRGDLNGDGRVSIDDLSGLNSYLALIEEIDGYHLLAIELTGDGYIDISDSSILYSYLALLVSDAQINSQ